MKEIFKYFFIFLLLIPLGLASLTVDLRDPTYSEGILTTEKGGVVTAANPHLRIQAKKIIYTRQETEEGLIITLEAEEDLIVEYGDYLFVGEKIEYDFQNRKGVLYDGHTSFEPWYFGGEKIYLCPNGSYVIYRGYATTSETEDPSWQIDAEITCLKDYRYLTARNVTFRFFSLPLFWMPSFYLNLDSIRDSPFRYTVRFGGSQGPRIGMRYEIFSWNRWSTHLLLDWRLQLGLGGGIETRYCAYDCKELFHAINYVAKDVTRYDHKDRTRYRFLGNYYKLFDQDRTSIHLSYDKLSDREMATDYRDKGLRLSTARRSQLEIRREDPNWVLNLLARFRANDFQTVKEELPTLSGILRPYTFKSTGIISEALVKGSYLELEYSDDRQNKVRDYNSPRYEVRNSFYRPFRLGQFTVTPEIGGLAIYYGNNAHHQDKWVVMALNELEITTDLYRFYGQQKHVVTPYLRYFYYTHPITPPDDHFIFDIDDGWFRLDTLRFGVENHLYTKTSNGCICRQLSLDLFAYAFFDTKTITPDIPWIYTRAVYYATSWLRNSIEAGWDIKRNMLDHFNYRVEWTINTDIAVMLEYRHRSPFRWRKADHLNFILESFRDAQELRKSALSDRRDTLLLHFFYRFHPLWAVDVYSRNGWNRKRESNYNEFQIDLLGTFQSAWQFKLAYRHRENEDRVFFNFSIGLRRPDISTYTECRIPALTF